METHPIDTYIQIALEHTATTYGYGEKGFCGDIHRPVACDNKAITASGERFNPNEPSIAVPAPKNLRVPKDKYVCLIDYKQDVIYIRVNDKKNPRRKGLDLSPGALKLLTGSSSPTWSGKLESCDNYEIETEELTEIEMEHLLL